MPLYNFTCNTCGERTRRLLEPEQAKKAAQASPFSCRKEGCAGILTRTPKAPTSQVVEHLDNGFMTKTLERPADAERLYRERAAQDLTKE